MELAIRIALTATLLELSMVASAGVNSWTAVGPEGGPVRKIVYNRATPTTLYMTADAGFFRTLDGGAHWQAVRTDFLNAPSDLDVDPSDPNRVYLVAGISVPNVLLSTDAGATFTPITSLSEGAHQIEVSPDGQTLYASNALRILRSVDRGVSWQDRGTVLSGDGSVVLLVIDPTNPNRLYAHVNTIANGPAVYVTNNGGASWTELPAATAAGSLLDMAIAGTTPSQLWIGGNQGVWVSADAGMHFTPVNVPMASPPLRGIGINPDNPSMVYVSDFYQGIYRTTDSGANWAEVTGNATVGAIMTFAVRSTPSQPEIFAAGIGGIAVSTVGGTTWTPRNTGFKGTRIRDLSADPASDRVYIAAEGAGLHYLSGTASATAPVNNDALCANAVSPRIALSTAVLAQEGRVFASLDNRIARSLDGGEHWTLTGYPTLPGTQAWWMTSSPANPQVILTGLQSVYRTTDGGNVWEPSTTGLPLGATNEHVEIAPSDPQVAYAAPYVAGTVSSPASQLFGVYRSANGGQTWSPANAGIENAGISDLAVDPTDARVVYISSNGKVFKTTNGGGSWTELSVPVQNFAGAAAIAVDSLHPRILYLAGAAAVVRSVDGGASWESLRDGRSLPFWFPTDLMPDPLRPHVLNVGTTASGVQQFTISPDLIMTLDAPSGSLNLGSQITYRYTIANQGPFHATGTEVTLQVPGNAQGVTFETSQGTCSAQSATCSLDTLRVGTPATVTVRATPAAVGAFRVSATVRSQQPDPAEGNNTEAREISVVDPPPPTPPTPPQTPPPAASSGGGGGAFSAFWLLLLAMISTVSGPARAVVDRRRWP